MYYTLIKIKYNTYLIYPRVMFFFTYTTKNTFNRYILQNGYHRSWDLSHLAFIMIDCVAFDPTAIITSPINWAGLSCPTSDSIQILIDITWSLSVQYQKIVRFYQLETVDAMSLFAV